MIQIINWSSLQSYKDRKPPWIRLHKTLLDNFEYHSMSADARAMLPMLWLLASEYKDPTAGIVDSSYEKIAFRLRMRNETVTEALREIERSGFITLSTPETVDTSGCNETVTKPLQNRNETVTPETEAETEAETKETCSFLFNEFWTKYPNHAGAGKTKVKDKFSKVIAKNDASAIFDGLDNMLEAIREGNLDKQFVPHAMTWLNQARWESVYEKKAKVPAHNLMGNFEKESGFE